MIPPTSSHQRGAAHLASPWICSHGAAHMAQTTGANQLEPPTWPRPTGAPLVPVHLESLILAAHMAPPTWPPISIRAAHLALPNAAAILSRHLKLLTWQPLSKPLSKRRSSTGANPLGIAHMKPTFAI